MKRIKKVVVVIFRFLMAMAGIILCMSDTSDLRLQIVFSTVGIMLFVFAVLPSLLDDGEEGLGSL